MNYATFKVKVMGSPTAVTSSHADSFGFICSSFETSATETFASSQSIGIFLQIGSLNSENQKQFPGNYFPSKIRSDCCLQQGLVESKVGKIPYIQLLSFKLNHKFCQ